MPRCYFAHTFKKDYHQCIDDSFLVTLSLELFDVKFVGEITSFDKNTFQHFFQLYELYKLRRNIFKNECLRGLPPHITTSVRWGALSRSIVHDSMSPFICVSSLDEHKTCSHRILT